MTLPPCLGLFQIGGKCSVQLLIVISLFLATKSCGGLVVRDKLKVVKPLFYISRSDAASEENDENPSVAKIKSYKLPVAATSLHRKTRNQLAKSISTTVFYKTSPRLKKEIRSGSLHQTLQSRNKMKGSGPSVIPRNSLRSSFKKILKDEEISQTGHGFKTNIRHSNSCPRSKTWPCYLKITVSTGDPTVDSVKFRKILAKSVTRLKRDFKSFFATAQVIIEKSSDTKVWQNLKTAARQTVKNTYNISFYVPWNIGIVWTHFPNSETLLNSTTSFPDNATLLNSSTSFPDNETLLNSSTGSNS